MRPYHFSFVKDALAYTRLWTVEIVLSNLSSVWHVMNEESSWKVGGWWDLIELTWHVPYLIAL